MAACLHAQGPCKPVAACGGASSAAGAGCPEDTPCGGVDHPAPRLLLQAASSSCCCPSGIASPGSSEQCHFDEGESSLCCEETLAEAEEEEEDEVPAAPATTGAHRLDHQSRLQQGGQHSTSYASRGLASASAGADTAAPCPHGGAAVPGLEVLEVLRNELAREAALLHGQAACHMPAASTGGADGGPGGAGGGSCGAAAAAALTSLSAAFGGGNVRAAVVGWMLQVAMSLGLQQESLFLSVTVLDRLALELVARSRVAVPQNMLQLMALACMFVACKQEEVCRHLASAETWLHLLPPGQKPEDTPRVDDLLRMEMVVLQRLGFRVRTPTPYSFLHLMCHALGCCSITTICAAAYLVELSLLDAEPDMLHAAGHSTVAAAALLLALTVPDDAPRPSHARTPSASGHGYADSASAGDSHAASAAAAAQGVCELVPCRPDAIGACLQRLVSLHQLAAVAPPGTVMAAVRAKFASEPWFRASLRPLRPGLLQQGFPQHG